MKIDIVTLFPQMFGGPFDQSIIKRAREENQVALDIHNLRKWTKDKRGTVDDKPYGGGIGMVMMVEPIVNAIDSLNHEYRISKSEINTKYKIQNTKVILLSPRGKVWRQEFAEKYSKLEHLILICGHYEGVDERVNNFIDEEISIGDYVLTGGEIPAMVIVDSIVRLLPGVLKKDEATSNESFSLSSKPEARNPKQYQISNIKYQNKLLEYPQYTHPKDYQGLKVPRVLLSGNHAQINQWRQEKALEKTKKNRPDLLPFQT